ncbi:TetR/AcrR family transcriptional regulator [Ferrimonas pelagia]|uniref:HTH tetR-type domain-containing protein n=1 Tax=Ferrimonas pelagia TaxID=1177826 RepID=A0ABP9EMS0_9GAMM
MQQDVSEHILDIAVLEIEQRGIVDFSLSGVAHSAHVSKSTVYKLYPTKDDVMLAVFRRELLLRLQQAQSVSHCSLLNNVEKVLTFHALSIALQCQSPSQHGLKFLPTNPTLWHKAKKSRVDEMTALLQRIYKFPEYLLEQACIAAEIKMSPRQIVLAELDLMAQERGYIVNILNVATRNQYLCLPIEHYVGSLEHQLLTHCDNPVLIVDRAKIARWIHRDLNLETHSN